MRVFGIAGLVIAWGALSGGPAVAEGLVLGDSLGMGVAQAAGLKGLARISVHIRGPRAIAQINSAPAGSTAFVVLGSNDAEGSIAGLDKSIDAIVQAAEKRGVKLVWLGPPCVRKPWNDRVRELDAMLERRFAQSAVKYVSMRDDKICSGAFQAGDGVHLTPKGYAYMWDKARAASGFTPTAADTAPRPAAGAASEPAPKSASRPRPQQKRVRVAATRSPPAAAAPAQDRHGGN
jgi:lysophospholipase L1-like esterase